MAINTLQNYAAALKQKLQYRRVYGSSVIGGRWVSISKLQTGFPPVFSAVADSAAGVVPVGGDVGFHLLQPFSGAGKLTAVEVNGGNSARLLFYDRLFHCGPYNTNNESVTLASQPSYSSRVPGGNYTGLQLWAESNNSNGAPTLTVTYTDQSGNAGASTSLALVSAGGAGGIAWQLPLASGDSGLSKIESVTTTATGSGTFNLFVARPLFIVESVPGCYMPMEDLGAPEVFSDSAFAVLMYLDSTSLGSQDIDIEIASG